MALAILLIPILLLGPGLAASWLGPGLVEVRVARALDADVRVGAVEGGWFAPLVILDLAVLDAAGEPVLMVPRLAADASLPAAILGGGPITLEASAATLHLDRPAPWVGRWLARLARGAAPGPDRRIVVSVPHGEIVLGDGPPAAITGSLAWEPSGRGLDMDLRVTGSAGEELRLLGSLGGDSDQRQLGVAARAWPLSRGEALLTSLTGVRVEGEIARLEVTVARVADRLALRGAVSASHLRIGGVDGGVWVPNGPVTLTGSIEIGEGSWSARDVLLGWSDGSCAVDVLDVVAEGDRWRGGVRLQAGGTDASEVAHLGLPLRDGLTPAGVWSLTCNLDGQYPGGDAGLPGIAAGLRGQAGLRLERLVTPVGDLRGLKAEVTGDGDTLRVDQFAATLAEGRLEVRGSLPLAPGRDGGVLHLEFPDGWSSDRALADGSRLLVSATGTLDMTLGRPSALVEGKLRLGSLRWERAGRPAVHIEDEELSLVGRVDDGWRVGAIPHLRLGGAAAPILLLRDAKRVGEGGRWEVPELDAWLPESLAAALADGLPLVPGGTTAGGAASGPVHVSGSLIWDPARERLSSGSLEVEVPLASIDGRMLEDVRASIVLEQAGGVLREGHARLSGGSIRFGGGWSGDGRPNRLEATLDQVPWAQEFRIPGAAEPVLAGAWTGDLRRVDDGSRVRWTWELAGQDVSLARGLDPQPGAPAVDTAGTLSVRDDGSWRLADASFVAAEGEHRIRLDLRELQAGPSRWSLDLSVEGSPTWLDPLLAPLHDSRIRLSGWTRATVLAQRPLEGGVSDLRLRADVRCEGGRILGEDFRNLVLDCDLEGGRLEVLAAELEGAGGRIEALGDLGLTPGARRPGDRFALTATNLDLRLQEGLGDAQEVTRAGVELSLVLEARGDASLDLELAGSVQEVSRELIEGGRMSAKVRLEGADVRGRGVIVGDPWPLEGGELRIVGSGSRIGIRNAVVEAGGARAALEVEGELDPLVVTALELGRAHGLWVPESPVRFWARPRWNAARGWRGSGTAIQEVSRLFGLPARNLLLEWSLGDGALSVSRALARVGAGRIELAPGSRIARGGGVWPIDLQLDFTAVPLAADAARWMAFLHPLFLLETDPRSALEGELGGRLRIAGIWPGESVGGAGLTGSGMFTLRGGRIRGSAALVPLAGPFPSTLAADLLGSLQRELLAGSGLGILPLPDLTLPLRLEGSRLELERPVEIRLRGLNLALSGGSSLLGPVAARIRVCRRLPPAPGPTGVSASALLLDPQRLAAALDPSILISGNLIGSPLAPGPYLEPRIVFRGGSAVPDG